MTRRRQVQKLDRNHPEIVIALRNIGVFVFEMGGVGGGFPDLYCVGVQPGDDGQLIRLIEVKDGEAIPSARKLRTSQIEFIAANARYGVTVHVVTSIDEALALFGARATA